MMDDINETLDGVRNVVGAFFFSREVKIGDGIECDYTNGKWVQDKMGPLYSGTSCGTIKEGQNCISHGRQDLGYLQWRWKPQQCRLPRFEPNKFLQLLRNKHLAFVGDSMARNQLESLLCLLSSVSSPDLVYTDSEENKFRKWRFETHNITVSIYWSPFLVKGIEKSNTGPYNQLFVDFVDEKWAQDLGGIDMIVLSIGHWFLHPARAAVAPMHIFNEIALISKSMKLNQFQNLRREAGGGERKNNRRREGERREKRR